LGAVVVAEGSSVSIDRLNVAFEPRVAVDVALAGGWLHLAPWFGASVLTRWQRFRVHDRVVLEIQPATVEAALCAAVTLP
jgi:hypothetical protein